MAQEIVWRHWFEIIEPMDAHRRHQGREGRMRGKETAHLAEGWESLAEGESAHGYRRCMHTIVVRREGTQNNYTAFGRKTEQTT